MTYEEVKNKLDKCEAALKQLKNSKNNRVSKEKVESLIIIQESLTKKLKTLIEADGVVSTDDEGKAEKLAKKGINVKLTNESLDHNQTVSQRQHSKLNEEKQRLGKKYYG